MKYRVANSSTGSYVVYRKFHYKPKLSIGSKGFLSVTLLSIGFFLSVPTPEDIIILSAIGKYFSQIFNLSTGKGILYATLVYKGIGVTLIGMAVILGGSYIGEKLKAQVRGHMNKLGKLCA